MTPDERQGGGQASARERRPIHVFAAAGWTIGVSLLLMLLLQLTETARPGALGDLVNLTACQVLAYSLVLFAMLRVYAPATPMRDALAFRPVAPLHVLLSAVAGAGISPALARLDDLVQARFPPPPEELEQQQHLLGEGKGILVVSVVFLVPIAEELFFRGMLYGGLRRGRSAGAAMFMTSLLFASSIGSGFDPRRAASAFVLALVLSWLRAQSGSVASSCAAHTAFYAVPIVALVTGKAPVESLAIQWIAVAMGAAICALVAGSFLGMRDEGAVEARGEDE